MLQEKLKAPKHGTNDSGSSSEKDDSSDEGAGLKKVRKSLTKKQKRLIEQKVQDTLGKAGAAFPKDDSESSSSGKESNESRGCLRKKKVKSGAKIQKRPVIKTELWPHTVANEEDGEQATSENISLAKFMSCFTFITATCKALESYGSSVLLHAVCLALENRPEQNFGDVLQSLHNFFSK